MGVSPEMASILRVPTADVIKDDSEKLPYVHAYASTNSRELLTRGHVTPKRLLECPTDPHTSLTPPCVPHVEITAALSMQAPLAEALSEASVSLQLKTQLWVKGLREHVEMYRGRSGYRGDCIGFGA